MNRHLILAIILTLVAAVPSGPARAHKVLASAYPAGEVIECEIGFSNGDMASDTTVEVYGPDGTLLGQTRTDAQGAFRDRPTQPVVLEFRADLGAGHTAAFTLSQEEVAQVVANLTAQEIAQPTTAQPGAPRSGAGAAGGGGGTLSAAAAGPVALSTADKQAIAKMVRDEVRPVYRELAAYREHNGLQTVLGGIGYILGLFGIGFYVAARRREV